MLKKHSIFIYTIYFLLIFIIITILSIHKNFFEIKENNFPLFFAPIQTSKEFIFADDIKVYFPTGKYAETGCWIVKTPCVAGVDGISAKKKYGFKIFYRKK